MDIHFVGVSYVSQQSLPEVLLNVRDCVNACKIRDFQTLGEKTKTKFS